MTTNLISGEVPSIKTTNPATETLPSLRRTAMPGQRKCFPSVEMVTDRLSLLPSPSSLESQHPTPSLNQAAVGSRMWTARQPRLALPTLVPSARPRQNALARDGTSKAHTAIGLDQQVATTTVATLMVSPHCGATPRTRGKDGSSVMPQSAGTAQLMISCT